MRILHIGKYYFPFNGGTEQVERDCVLALKEGNEQEVLCFNHEKGNSEGFVDDVKIVRAGCFLKISSQSLSFSYKKLLKKAFREFRPEIVIFHYPNPFAAHYLLKQLKRHPECKLIVYWHLDITKQKILGKFFRGQTMRLLKRAEKVVSTSPNYIDGSKFLTAFREKCVVIPNCVSGISPSERAQTLAGEIKEQNAGKTILFALGRHVPYKGMEYLIKASKKLSDRYVVFIGGEGPLTPSLKELAKGDEKVRFLGKIDDDTKNAYLTVCDIFCFPSITRNEAFGIALAEALAFGKPAVTFTIPGSGVNYVSLNGVTGLEVENGNAEEYALAIEKLASDHALSQKYGEAGQKRVRELFTFEKFRENILALTRSIGL